MSDNLSLGRLINELDEEEGLSSWEISKKLGLTVDEVQDLQIGYLLKSVKLVIQQIKETKGIK